MPRVTKLSSIIRQICFCLRRDCASSEDLGELGVRQVGVRISLLMAIEAAIRQGRNLFRAGDPHYEHVHVHRVGNSGLAPATSGEIRDSKRGLSMLLYMQLVYAPRVCGVCVRARVSARACLFMWMFERVYVCVRMHEFHVCTVSLVFASVDLPSNAPALTRVISLRTGAVLPANQPCAANLKLVVSSFCYGPLAWICQASEANFWDS
jgi:hypothetical protein